MGEQELNAMAAENMQRYGNCAQASFHTLHKALRLECDHICILRGLAPFPGVGLTFETCGAVSGSLLAIGIALGATDPADQQRKALCYQVGNRFSSAVREELGSTRCGDIMERQFGRRFDLTDAAQKQQFTEAGAREKCTEVVQIAVQLAKRVLKTAGSPSANAAGTVAT